MISENRQAYKQNFWREHSAAWESSGLTQQTYCEHHSISYQSFVYQHNRMANKLKRSAINFVEAKPEAATMNTQTAIKERTEL